MPRFYDLRVAVQLDRELLHLFQRQTQWPCTGEAHNSRFVQLLCYAVVQEKRFAIYAQRS